MSAEFLQFGGIEIGMVPGMDIQEVLMVFEQPVVFIGNVVGKQVAANSHGCPGISGNRRHEEGADHQFLIAPVPVSHGRRLQTMTVVVHLVPETLDMLLGPQKPRACSAWCSL